MKKFFLAFLLCLGVSFTAHAQPSQLPEFTLPDPQGTLHSSSQLAAHGIVIIVSAPTLHNKKAQEQWAQWLASTRGSHRASLVLLEDMAASAFEGIARKKMKESWKPGDLPILLEDSTGKVHNAFHLANNETKVFVYDRQGSLVDSYGGEPSREKAQALWGKLD